MKPEMRALSIAAFCQSLLVACCRYDVEALRQVRQFKGHKDRVTGLVVSQDAKWLLSSSMDGTVRIWDVPAAACLQVLPLSSVVELCTIQKLYRRMCMAVTFFGNPLTSKLEG